MCAVFREHIARIELAAAGIVSSLCKYGGGGAVVTVTVRSRKGERFKSGSRGKAFAIVPPLLKGLERTRI